MSPAHISKPDVADALVDSKNLQSSFIPVPLITFVVDQPNMNCEICPERMVFGRANAIKDGQKPGILPCGHVAHMTCLQTWLSSASERSRKYEQVKPCCPFCRTTMTYELCAHVVHPKVIDTTTLPMLPRTIPDGGKIPDQCSECRVKTAEETARTVQRSSVATFVKARERYEQKRSTENRIRMLQAKDTATYWLQESIHIKTVVSVLTEW
jgi:hypothetical protein